MPRLSQARGSTARTRYTQTRMRPMQVITSSRTLQLHQSSAKAQAPPPSGRRTSASTDSIRSILVARRRQGLRITRLTILEQCGNLSWPVQRSRARLIGLGGLTPSTRPRRHHLRANTAWLTARTACPRRFIHPSRARLIVLRSQGACMPRRSREHRRQGWESTS